MIALYVHVLHWTSSGRINVDGIKLALPIVISRNLVFADVGSGCGRLVMAQALKWPWRSCLGVEKVRSLHQMGEAAISAAREMASIGAGGITGQEQTEGISSEASQVLQGMAPCDLSLGDIYDEVCT